MRMRKKIEKSDSIRRNATRFGAVLGAAALLLVAACSNGKETVPEQTINDDQAVMQQSEKSNATDAHRQ